MLTAVASVSMSDVIIAIDVGVYSLSKVALLLNQEFSGSNLRRTSIREEPFSF